MELIVEFISKSGTRIEKLKVRKEIHEEYTLVQFPIILSYATSVHKVQGMTLKSVIVGDIRDFWCSQQLYVAISRVRSSEDILFIQPDNRTHGFTRDDLIRNGLIMKGNITKRQIFKQGFSKSTIIDSAF